MSFRIRYKQFLASRWLPKHQPLSFIILSAPRTGSTLLHTYLNSHWNIISMGEYLGASERQGIMPRIDKVFRGKRGFSIKAVGCKVFYDYFESIALRPSIEYLQQLPDLHVIHLTRKNMLESYISLQNARASEAWTGTVLNQPLNVDVSDCIDYFKNLEGAQKRFTRVFSQQPILSITYEDLVSNKEETLAMVTSFLQVPHQSMKSILKAQAQGSLSERILNYAEVCEALEGTKWERFISTP